MRFIDILFIFGMGFLWGYLIGWWNTTQKTRIEQVKKLFKEEEKC